MTTHRARNGPIMAVLVALVMCLVCIGFVTTSLDVAADTGTVVNSATQLVVVNTEASFTIKEAHCDVVFGTSAAISVANTETAITTALTTTAVTGRGTATAESLTGNIASPPATVVNVYMMARNGIMATVAKPNLTAIVVNKIKAPATTGGECFGAWLATSHSLVLSPA